MIVFPTNVGTGVNQAQAVQISEGFVSLSTARLLAREGNIAQSISIVQVQPDNLDGVADNVFICSLADRNQIFINDVYVQSFDLGEVYSYRGNVGDKILTTGGHSGGVNHVGQSIASLNYESNAGTSFLVYHFRVGNYKGYFFITCGAVSANVQIRDQSNNLLFDQTLNAFQTVQYQSTITVAQEYKITSDNPVFVAVASSDISRDNRLSPPLSNILIGHVRSAQVSTIDPSTSLSFYSGLGNTANGTVSPNTPFLISSVLASEGASTAYNPDGYCIIYSSGRIASFAGADGGGWAATEYVNPNLLPTRVGLYLPAYKDDTADRVSLSFASLYTGTVNIYSPSGTLINSGNLRRHTSIPFPATTSEHQKYPAVYRYLTVANELVPGCYIEANVPIYAVAQFSDWDGTDFVQYDAEETVLYGIRHIEPEITLNSQGLYVRRDISGTTETWEVC